MRPVPRIATEGGWALADQGLSSLTTFALSVVVARSATPSEFGAFGLAMAAYWAYLAVVRSVAIGPLTVRYAGAPTALWRDATADAVGMAALLGIGGAAGFLLIGLAAGATLGQLFLAVGIGLPGLIVRDAFRYAFFAAGRGRAAFANHFVWTGLFLFGLAIAALLDAPPITAPTLIWSATAAAASGVAALQARLLPRPARVAQWWSAHRDLATRYGADSITTSAATQVSLYGVGAVAGISAVAAIRGAELLLGPLQVVFQGAQLAAVPHGVALGRRAPRSARNEALTLAVVLGGVALIWGGLALSIPEALGTELLGRTWSDARAILVPMTLAAIALAVRTGASVGILSLAAAHRTLRANAVGSAGLVAGAIGGATFGAVGAAWGLAVMGVVSAAIFLHQLEAALDEQPRSAPEPNASTVDGDALTE